MRKHGLRIGSFLTIFVCLKLLDKIPNGRICADTRTKVGSNKQNMTKIKQKDLQMRSIRKVQQFGSWKLGKMLAIEINEPKKIIKDKNVLAKKIPHISSL